MPDVGRYRFCPMCRAGLGMRADLDGIDRVCCESCGWTYYPTNVLGVNVVPITDDGDIVVILPPNEPDDTPAALPGGVVEYGESPEEAAVRETYEETGLHVGIERELGRWFDTAFEYGPMLSIMFQARVRGGYMRSSPEGHAAIIPVAEMPPISPLRRGSSLAWHAYVEFSNRSRRTRR